MSVRDDVRLQHDSRTAIVDRPLTLPLVLLLALMLRMGAAVWVEQQVQQSGRQFFVEGDANGYWHLGQMLAAGEEYSIHYPPRRIMRVPGFPLLLAGSIQIFGDSVFAARCVLAVVGAACCWLVFLLGRSLVNRAAGLLAAAMMSVHPLQVGNSVLILSETWFTFWMLASLVSLMKVLEVTKPDSQVSSDSDTAGDRRQSSWLFAGLSGMLIAAAVLVRPGFLPWLAPCAVVVLIFGQGTLIRRGLLVGTIGILFALTMLPWIVRNHQVSGHWVLTSLWSGPSMYDGLNPDADGTSDMTFFDADNVMSRMTEFEMNAHYQQRSIQFVKDQPGRSVTLAGLKLLKFLQAVPSTLQGGWVVTVGCVTGYAVFCVLCLTGLATGWIRLPGILVTTGPFLLFLAVHMVFVGSLRYRLPVEFPLAIVAATGLQWFWKQLLTPTVSRRPIAGDQ